MGKDALTPNERKYKSFLASVSATVALVFTGYMYLDGKYALATEHVKLEQKVTKIELKITYQKALDNLYNYRDLSRKYPTDVKLQDELKRAQQEVDFLKLQLENKKSKRTYASEELEEI